MRLLGRRQNELPREGRGRVATFTLSGLELGRVSLRPGVGPRSTLEFLGLQTPHSRLCLRRHIASRSAPVLTSASETLGSGSGPTLAQEACLGSPTMLASPLALWV